MTFMKRLQFNRSGLKMLVILVATVLLVVSHRTVTYASEIITTEQNPTDISNDADTTLENQDLDTTTEDEITSADGQGVTLGEGYYVDEQGQVYYDETKIKVEEPVIDGTADVGLNDNEDTDKSTTTKKDSKATTKDSKAKTASADTKVTKKAEKEPVVKAPTYSEADLRLLACLVYSEAGNQPYQGQLAVANVVLNRVKSDVYWNANTIKEVIYDRKWAVQFAVTIKCSSTGLSPLDKALKAYDSGKFSGGNPGAEENAMNSAIKAAKAALEGTNNIGGYLCFTNKREASSIKKRNSDYLIIGDHIFYRTN